MTFEHMPTCPQRSRASCQRGMRLTGIGLVLLGLTGCSWVGMALKESAISATGRSGWDSFTFAGDLPAHFGLEVNPGYDPIDPDSSVCQRQNLYGEWSARYFGTTHKVPIKPAAHSFALKLPLTYSVGLCTMRLTEIEIVVHAAHGDQAWQRTTDRGRFRVVDRLPDGVAGFDARGRVEFPAECRWLFQQSVARSRVGELEKLLFCSATGTFLQYDQLAGKTVTLAVAVNPEEEPYRDNTWTKFPNGWKPCLPKEGGWQSCQTPPIFKTFKMNGQTCTVYPGCTE
ncbi:hypothetical protein V0R50_18420 [Pseudomonas sp. 148P]|uniref:Lipoprotein n=1 Tax=Pseudomonas ulcerans TaxID=3115852 RepID=A0ABU7HUJ4_9PSED|nr:MULTISPECIES: hypothetical protein [unclassified Pseudomonas]MEE1924028.1 hypothetical protein [Pseudomonas sp. 147P]MEE1935209.1 hypothetical protein [Pseudomonas sp. 148P]